MQLLERPVYYLQVHSYLRLLAMGHVQRLQAGAASCSSNTACSSWILTACCLLQHHPGKSVTKSILQTSEDDVVLLRCTGQTAINRH